MVDLAFAESVGSPLPEIRVKPFNVTAEMIGAALTVGERRVMKWPTSIVELFRPGITDHVVWPTSVLVTRIMLSVDPAPGQEPPQTVWSDVSLLGLGWQPSLTVSLKWNNAWDFPGTSIALGDVVPDSHGFFGLEVAHKTVRRHPPDYEWSFMNTLVIVAQQKDASGKIVLNAEERGIPPHVIWQWVP
jgi:hypothetical protein